MTSIPTRGTSDLAADRNSRAPVLAMLHQLAARRAPREIWWIHGAWRLQERQMLICGALPATDVVLDM